MPNPTYGIRLSNQDVERIREHTGAAPDASVSTMLRIALGTLLGTAPSRDHGGRQPGGRVIETDSGRRYVLPS